MIIGLPGTGTTHGLTTSGDLPFVDDLFAAYGTMDAQARSRNELLDRGAELHLGQRQELLVRHDLVGVQLGRVPWLVGQQSGSFLTGIPGRRNPHGLPGLHIHQSSSGFAVVFHTRRVR